MNSTFLFVFNSLALGVGLAMDAFSVSLANGLNEPQMKFSRMNLIAGTYGFFQFAMPFLGWFFVSFLAKVFEKFQTFIPLIALCLLVYIGISMILETVRNKDSENQTYKLGFSQLIVQGIATSIDALSVGFAISTYNMFEAFVSSLIIGFTTHVICVAGLEIGKKAGTKLKNKAGIIGGIILIAIGLEIFFK